VVVVKHKPALKAKAARVHHHPMHKALPTLPPGHKRFTWRKHNYYFHQGHYYWNINGAYVRVGAPVGYTLTVLPPGYRIFHWMNRDYFYYLGVFYQLDEQKRNYVVITPPDGIEIDDLPQEDEIVQFNGATFHYVLGSFYRHDPGHKRFVATHPPRGLVVKSIPEDYEIKERDNREVLVCNGVVFEVDESGDEIVYRVIE